MPRRTTLLMTAAAVLILPAAAFTAGLATAQATSEPRAEIRAALATIVELRQAELDRRHAAHGQGRVSRHEVFRAERDLLRDRIHLAIINLDIEAAREDARRTIELCREAAAQVQANQERVDPSDLAQARIDVAEAEIAAQLLMSKTSETLLAEAMMYRP